MLLFDANLSPRLILELNKDFPDSQHVISIGLEKHDVSIREYAKSNKLTIISKDQDFFQLYLEFGHPPKFIWIKRGNCQTKEILELLIINKTLIHNFLLDQDIGLLILK
ncbi:DUF5615 family PIN-like protein [Leptospira sp. GIMC2001]|uniref:DUF5615 family PIN-like protein n=1 Tax=Leptospira sp. GIMC2001 TaxID=1513297 RepID=UPI002349F18E|nr:DUF5615 family PIN-like protein [Leptospira sp. GIMC2001]WCL48658.1 DUF5615 family PIN-like protein [Leptospira sp. GIMC2001]